MKVKKNASGITITIDSEFEADIMLACLNWGYSAMHKSGLVKCDDTPEDTAKCKVEWYMWEEFWKVHKFSKEYIENKEVDKNIVATEIIQRLEKMLAPEYKFSKYKLETKDSEPRPTGDWILLNEQLETLKKEFGEK
jgi:hypothetical protein